MRTSSFILHKEETTIDLDVAAISLTTIPTTNK